MTVAKNVEGLFYEEPEEVYHADALYEAPSLSSSLCKYLIDGTPRHAWYASPRLNPNFKPKNRDIFDKGKVVHSLTLGSGAEIVQGDFDNWMTKEAKAFKKDAHEAGKTPILASQYRDIKEAVAAQREQLEALDCGNPFDRGQPEVVIRWKEEFVHKGETVSVWCRARLDNLDEESDNAYDLKSTEASANPAKWVGRTMWGISAPYQAAFYRRGLRRLTKIGKLKCHDPNLIFIVVESTAPYCLSAITVPSDIKVPYSEQTVDEKLSEAIALWQTCLESDFWPGYSTEVHDAEQFSFKRKPSRPEPSTGGASFHQDSQDVPDELYTPITFKNGPK